MNFSKVDSSNIFASKTCKINHFGNKIHLDFKVHRDSPIPSEGGDSGVPSDLQSMSSLSISVDALAEKDGTVNEADIGELGQSLESALYAALPNIPKVQVCLILTHCNAPFLCPPKT